MHAVKVTVLLAVAGALLGAAGCGAATSASSTAATGSHPVQSPPASRTVPIAPDVANAQLVSLAMASPTRGYGMFDTSAGARCEALSGRTADGGARFGSPALVTSWSCGGNPPVTAIAADGSGDEFAYGPQLYISRNATGTWLASPQPGAVLAVSALGRSVWMMLAKCDAASCRLVLVESADGGRTWRRARTQPPGATARAMAGGRPAGEPAAGQTWLVRTGLDSGYVMSSPAVNPRGQPDVAPLWYTANAGVTWSRRQLPCGLDALSAVLSAAPGGPLTAVCAAEPSAGSQVKSAATSVNGGRTWTLRVIPCPQLAAACRDPLVGGYLSEIAAVSARTIYLAGVRSSLLVSTDGGARWTAVRPLIGDGSGGTFQVSFFGRADGLVLGDDSGSNEAITIWCTTDSGRTWSKAVPTLG